MIYLHNASNMQNFDNPAFPYNSNYKIGKITCPSGVIVQHQNCFIINSSTHNRWVNDTGNWYELNISESGTYRITFVAGSIRYSTGVLKWNHYLRKISVNQTPVTYVVALGDTFDSDDRYIDTQYVLPGYYESDLFGFANIQSVEQNYNITQKSYKDFSLSAGIHKVYYYASLDDDFLGIYHQGSIIYHIHKI